VDGQAHAPRAREERESLPAAEPKAPASAGPLAPQKGFTPERILALQRVAGNAAVTAMIDQHAAGPGAAATNGHAAANGNGAGPAIPIASPGRNGAAAETATAGAANGAATGAAAGAGAANGAAAGAAAGGAAGAAAGGAAAGAPGVADRDRDGAAEPARDGPAASAAAAPAAPAAPGGGGGGGAPAAPRDPHQDPDFQAMKKRGGGAATTSKSHPPAAGEAASAQAAALPPSNDVSSQAAAAQVDEMEKQEPGTFDKKAFIAAVKKAIDKAAPKNLEEADDFEGSGKAAQVKDEVSGQVSEGKQESEKDIKTATEAAPDTSKAKPKPVKAMTNKEADPVTKDVGAKEAMPKKRAEAETDLSQGPKDVDSKMAEADVTEEQLKKSNEPDFTGALKARDEARKDSETRPADYRKQEQQVLDKSHGEAETKATAQLEGMRGDQVQALAKAVGHKTEAKGADEGKRGKVATEIEGIYDRTKKDVTKILDDLDGKVDSAFSKGEKSARDQFEKYVGKRMDAYKDERYSGLIGKGRWVKDKLLGMPDEVNAFYEEGRDAYLKAMDVVISDVADVVGRELGAARKRITEGRKEVRKYVDSLPADLQKIGKDAEKDLQSKFDQLSSDVDAKQDQLVDTLAQKYVEARDKLDERIEEMKAANRGLVDKAIDAVKGVIDTILKLKDMLLSVLAKAADVIGDIIKDPIGFLGKLVDGVKSGLNKFIGNIASHLQKGLMDWLFGALGSAGLVMPAKLDMAGIFDLVMQVLGLTYDNIRNRVAKLVGEPAVARMEKTVDVFKTLATKGIAGLWELIKDQLANLEELVLGQIKEFVIERVIKAGITWIISLLNPAAAFIKACKAIYDIVMWIVERGAQIMEFVNSVLDSIGAIAKGNIGIVADRVEGALAKALPVAISFLASLLGLGGISEKIRSIIDTVRAPINKAVDFVVKGAIKTFKKLFAKPMAWAKGKYEKGKAWVKGKVEAGKQRIKEKVYGGDDSAEGKQKRLESAMNAALRVTGRFSGKFVGERSLTALLTPIRLRYGLTELVPVKEGDTWFIEGAINPRDKKSTGAKVPDPSKPGGDGKEEDGDDSNKGALLERRVESVQQGIAGAKEQLKDSEVQKALKTNGRLKGEIEEELRQLDSEFPAIKNDAGTAVELEDDSLIDEMLGKVDAMQKRVDEVQRKIKGVKPEEVDPDAKRAAMRFQVQWATEDRKSKRARTYSAVRVTTDPPGVTVAEAQSGLDEAHGKVAESEAREAAAAAVAKQKTWVAGFPPTGWVGNNVSHSEYFELRGETDARVDVENQEGHNLKE
jgi:hypothetical protein